MVRQCLLRILGSRKPPRVYMNPLGISYPAHKGTVLIPPLWYLVLVVVSLGPSYIAKLARSSFRYRRGRKRQVEKPSPAEKRP